MPIPNLHDLHTGAGTIIISLLPHSLPRTLFTPSSLIRKSHPRSVSCTPPSTPPLRFLPPRRNPARPISPSSPLLPQTSTRHSASCGKPHTTTTTLSRARWFNSRSFLSAITTCAPLSTPFSLASPRSSRLLLLPSSSLAPSHPPFSRFLSSPISITLSTRFFPRPQTPSLLLLSLHQVKRPSRS